MTVQYPTGHKGIPKFYLGDKIFEVHADTDLKGAIEDCLSDGGGVTFVDLETCSPPSADCPIEIPGDGGLSETSIRLMGRGPYATSVIQPESKVILEPKNGVGLGIENIGFWTGTTGTFAPLLQGEDDGADTKRCLGPGSYFKDTYWRSRSGPTGAGYLVDLKNPFRWDIRGSNKWVPYSGTGGLQITGTDVEAKRSGDSHWSGVMEFILGATNQIAMRIAKVTADPTLIDGDAKIVVNSNDLAGTKALKAEYLRHSRFPRLHMENIKDGVDLDYCMDVIAGSSYTDILNGGTAFKSSNSIHGVQFRDIKLVANPGDTIKAWDVDNNSAILGEDIINWRIMGTGTWTPSDVNYTRIKDIRSNAGRSEQWSNQVIPVGDGYKDFSHGLFRVPVRGSLVPRNAESVKAYISSYDQGGAGTTARITCPDLTGDGNVDVFLTINNRMG